MTGLDERPWRSRLADRLPWRTALTVLSGAIELVDLGMRLYSRIVRCCPTRTTREVQPPPVYPSARALTRTTITTTNPSVVWLNTGNAAAGDPTGGWR